MKRVVEWVVGIFVAAGTGYSLTWMTTRIVSRLGIDADEYSSDLINLCVVGGALVLGYLAATSRGNGHRIRGAIVATIGTTALSAAAALLSGMIYRIPNDFISMLIGVPAIILFLIILIGSIKLWRLAYVQHPKATAD